MQVWNQRGLISVDDGSSAWILRVGSSLRVRAPRTASHAWPHIHEATALAALGSHPFWGSRSKYNVVAGLLWGRPFPDEAIDVASLFALYRKQLRDVPLVGFETRQQADGNLSIEEFAERPPRPGASSLLV